MPVGKKSNRTKIEKTTRTKCFSCPPERTSCVGHCTLWSEMIGTKTKHPECLARMSVLALSVYFVIVYIILFIILELYVTHAGTWAYIGTVVPAQLFWLAVKLHDKPSDLSWFKTFAPIWFPPILCVTLFIAIPCFLAGYNAIAGLFAKLLD